MSSLSLNEMVNPPVERKPSGDDSDAKMEYMDMIRPQERPNFESSENWSNFGMLSNSFSRTRSVSQLEQSQGLPPWLLSPDGTRQSVSWLPTGFNPDASLPNLDLDAPTAVTVDENDVVDDDDSRRELRGGQQMEKSQDDVVGDEQLLERLQKMGISEFITTNGEDDLPDDLSDLSNGNASYIMDLAHQKENREKLLKEECLESALALYKRASGDGHAGQEVFLTILSHVQKRKRISKRKFYKLQDQRLEDALQDELKLRDSQDVDDDDNSITIGEELGSIAESSKQENNESEWHESEYDWGEVGGNSSGDLAPSGDTDKKKRSSKKKKRASSKSRDSKTRPTKSKSDMTSVRGKKDWRSLSVGSLSTSDHGNSSDHGDKFQFLRRSLNDLEAVQEEPTPGKPKKKTSKKDKKATSSDDPLKKSKSKKTSKKKKSNSMTPSERTVESTAASSQFSEDMDITGSSSSLRREEFVAEDKASPTKTKKKKKTLKSSTSSEEMEVIKSTSETKPVEDVGDGDAAMKSPTTSKRKKSASKKATKSDSLTMTSPTSPKKKRMASKKAFSEPYLVAPPPESPKKKKSTKKSSVTSQSKQSKEKTEDSVIKPLAKAPESPSKPASSTTATASTSTSSKKTNSKKAAGITGIVTSMFGHKKSSKDSSTTDDKKRRGLLSRFKSRSSDNVLDPKDRLLPIPGSQIPSITT
eukprot:Nitzschia sp. Nitz4//scaffold65_size103378//48264//50363//NITZ4_004467-RA/size103378-processed-gene-0.118-mRNA-1//1//CDS//3329556243//3833//frame0